MMMNSMWLTIVFVLVIFVVKNTNGLPRFANYFQDHMVLQRAPQRAIVWGYADSSNASITLRMNNQIHTTVSLSESIWSVTLDPVSDEGPFDIHVSQSLTNGTNVTITLHDILFGDVWICSGQSNMQMSVIDVFNGTEEINNAGNFTKLRLFTVALIPSASPIEELLGMWLNWSVASPQSVGGPSFTYMSAVCWLYGRMIHQALNGRPMGLIATSWGGTNIELWMPPQALQDCKISNGNLNIDGAPTLNNSNLFNSMIYPFTRMTIYGVIWYQGESNAEHNRDKYSCAFSKMIEYWRMVWYARTNGSTDLQFPFGFVQLATFENNSMIVGGFPWIRWHQTFDVGYVPNNVVPKVFMAVALDLRDDPNRSVQEKNKISYSYYN